MVDLDSGREIRLTRAFVMACTGPDKPFIPRIPKKWYHNWVFGHLKLQRAVERIDSRACRTSMLHGGCQGHPLQQQQDQGRCLRQPPHLVRYLL